MAMHISEARHYYFLKSNSIFFSTTNKAKVRPHNMYQKVPERRVSFFPWDE